jgi:hypothetical protein
VRLSSLAVVELIRPVGLCFAAVLVRNNPNEYSNEYAKSC